MYTVLMLLLVLVLETPGNDSEKYDIKICPPFDSISLTTGDTIVFDTEAEVYRELQEWNISPIKGSHCRIRYILHPGSGSGWTVGITDNSDAAAFYFSTTTSGYRTVSPVIDTPLPWSTDCNTDGVDEIIIWDSYAVCESPTLSDYGLVAWVYEKKEDHLFVINYSYTYGLWEKIISSYRKRHRYAGKNDSVYSVTREVFIKSFENRIPGAGTE
ncbi:MAG: hypothetical protein ACQEQ4_07565 [Fibrobacterota bacterium]